MSSVEARLREQVAALGAIFNEEVLAATRACYLPHLPAGLPPGVRCEQDLAYGAAARQRLDLYLPAAEVRGLLLFVHGGGFVAGDKRAGDRFFANIGGYFARHGIATAAMNYRLAPAHAWPAGTEDVALAATWLRRRVEGRKLFVIGQSAGAAHVAGFLFDPLHAEAAGASIAGAVLMSGFYQASAPLRAGPLGYFGDDEASYARRSPASHVAANTRLPLLLTVAELDPAPIAEQTLILAGALTRARGRCPPLDWLPGHNHVSPVLSIGSVQEDVATRLLRFIDELI